MRLKPTVPKIHRGFLSMGKEKRLLDFNKAIILLLIISIFIIIKAALAPQTYSLEQEANIVLAKLVYAALLTLIVVLVTIFVTRLF